MRKLNVENGRSDRYRKIVRNNLMRELSTDFET